MAIEDVIEFGERIRLLGEEHTRYRMALEAIMAEVGTSTLAHKIAREALSRPDTKPAQVTQDVTEVAVSHASDDSFRCLGCRGVIATPKVCLDCYEAGVRETDSSKAGTDV